MPFPYDSKEMEYKNFRDAGNGKTKRAVEIENNQENAIPVTTLGVVWDSLQVSFPSSNQELFQYYKENNPVLEVLVTYQNPNKKQIISLTRKVF